MSHSHLSDNDLHHLAWLSWLSLEGESLIHMREDLGRIIEFVGQLSSVDCGDTIVPTHLSWSVVACDAHAIHDADGPDGCWVTDQDLLANVPHSIPTTWVGRHHIDLKVTLVQE
jgi:Asp-tRNA(Asn)/Glu-tRNA(Gln) amidotransferase C subunit